MCIGMAYAIFSYGFRVLAFEFLMYFENRILWRDCFSTWINEDDKSDKRKLVPSIISLHDDPIPLGFILSPSNFSTFSFKKSR